MKIGELSRATGTNAETIRYYERIGLLPKPGRTDGNYRDYGAADQERLTFIRHARGLGFDIADIRSLLNLAEDPGGDCGEADRIATGHLDAVERKIEQLEQLRVELRRMIKQCRGGQIADCRIMQSLGDHRLCDGDHSGPPFPRSSEATSSRSPIERS
jgi:Cu(I)-responsive transcriptional regulator